MSINRYTIVTINGEWQVRGDPHGEWVRIENALSLEAEVERLQARERELAAALDLWNETGDCIMEVTVGRRAPLSDSEVVSVIEGLRGAICAWAETRTRTYGFSSDADAAQQRADETLLDIARAVSAETEDDT